MTPKKPARKSPCHVEQSFEIVGRSVAAITTRLEAAELLVAEMDKTVLRLTREIDRLKQPWWRRLL